MDLWFTERHTAHAGLTMQVKQTLFSGESDYQKIEVIDTLEFGRVLLLDDLVMVTERDEFAYHEMLVHPALFSHPRPSRVLVLGGGDGGTIREIVRHPDVDEAVLCERDGLVVETAVAYLPGMASAIDGSHPKVTVRIEDGLAYLQANPSAFDIILIDTNDPLGPDVGLVEEVYYRTVKTALKPDGILVTQTESPFYHAEVQRGIYGTLRALFPIVEMYQAFVPSYPSGLWSFAFASRSYHPTRDFDRERATRYSFPTRYYNEDLHCGAFMLPTFMRESIIERRQTPRHAGP